MANVHPDVHGRVVVVIEGSDARKTGHSEHKNGRCNEKDCFAYHSLRQNTLKEF